MLLACPLALSAATLPGKFFPQYPQKEDKGLLNKNNTGYITHKERNLVNWLWNIYKNRRTARVLNKIIKGDFQSIDVTGTTYDKKQFITGLLQSSQILSYQISGLKMIRTHESIVAFYVIGLTLSTSEGLVLPMAQMNVFQKADGKWKLKATSDLDIFNILI